MPELPEVETTRRGIAPYLVGARIARVTVRTPCLRHPVSPQLVREAPGQILQSVDRRGKYLLLRCPAGSVIIHLGMSGSLRVLPDDVPPERHDHVDIVLDSGHMLRLRDPRRFGSVLWTRQEPLQHALLRGLGPEPLSDGFSGDHLYRRSRGRRLAVKQFIMDHHIVTGVGNIYASEALFLAGIHPSREAGRISLERYARLAAAIRQVLAQAIAQGGTTLRDFYNGEGKPGYFQQQLKVYGRAGQPCTTCGRPVAQTRQGQRSSFYCTACQR
ncbi:MAG: bifunctional DNA-formamidopyrimidine glycosylase/DNA-(apurinic or apyrimidinic site) lyase [Gammaproteobacteria bacterium]|nr:bifunctional DNA-formamidopyrimidine glycosylase/DNA-(apurinic or apyrimidinic site) lyase [Gammaproteobacteria bacterium]